MRNFEREALAFSEAVANFARQKMLEITVALDVRTLLLRKFPGFSI